MEAEFNLREVGTEVLYSVFQKRDCSYENFYKHFE
jgi:hypothetical protein